MNIAPLLTEITVWNRTVTVGGQARRYAGCEATTMPAAMPGQRG
jgi:hypothetical protein